MKKCIVIIRDTSEIEIHNHALYLVGSEYHCKDCNLVLSEVASRKVEKTMAEMGIKKGVITNEFIVL